MNPEKPGRFLRIALMLALAAAAVIAVRRASDDSFVVTVVDQETKQPLTNAVARVVTRWTTLQVEKLGLGVSPSVRRELRSQGGVFRIRGFRPSTDPWVEVCADGYFCAYLSLDHGALQIAYDWRGETRFLVGVTNRATIRMRRLPKEASQP